MSRDGSTYVTWPGDKAQSPPSTEHGVLCTVNVPFSRTSVVVGGHERRCVERRISALQVQAKKFVTQMETYRCSPCNVALDHEQVLAEFDSKETHLSPVFTLEREKRLEVQTMSRQRQQTRQSRFHRPYPKSFLRSSTGGSFPRHTPTRPEKRRDGAACSGTRERPTAHRPNSSREGRHRRTP